MSRATSTDYSLGVSAPEVSRLLAQCEDHRPAAEHLLDRIGLHRGSRVVDLGCGPLGILDVLARRVGSSGVVVGVDRARPCLREAARQLRARGLTRVGLVEAAAAATGLSADSFDLVHERLLLVNLPRPVDVLTEVVRLTRPGGYVAVQDVDWISWTCMPPHPDWTRLAAAAAAVWSGDVHLGRHLPALLRQARLVDVRFDASVGVFGPDHPNHQLLPRLVEQHRPRILAAGLLTADELETALARVTEHLADPATVTLHPTLCIAWGAKPTRDPLPDFGGAAASPRGDRRHHRGRLGR